MGEIFRDLSYIRLYFGSFLESPDLGARWTARERAIEDRSSFRCHNDCDLRCLPRPVSKGNSRSVSAVILLSPSLPLPLRFARPLGRPCSELQADLQGAVDLQAGQEWPFLFAAPDPEIVEKYRKTGPRTERWRNARKKRSHRHFDISPRTVYVPRYIVGRSGRILEESR